MNSCVIKKSMKTLSGEASLFMWGALFCFNSLGFPVNLCTIGAHGRDCVMSVQSVQPMFVLLSSSLSLLFQEETSLSDMWSLELEFKINCCTMSSSSSFLFKVILHSERTTRNCILDFGTWNKLTSQLMLSQNAWVFPIEELKKLQLLSAHWFSCRNNYFMALGFVFRQWHNAFYLKISSVLEIKFSEPDWYKNKCKSALVRPLLLYWLPDLYFPAQIKMDLGTGCNLPPKTLTIQMSITRPWSIGYLLL
jgi:hypothetical protein